MLSKQKTQDGGGEDDQDVAGILGDRRRALEKEYAIADQAATDCRRKGQGEKPHPIVSPFQSRQGSGEAEEESGREVDVNREYKVTFEHSV